MLLCSLANKYQEYLLHFYYVPYSKHNSPCRDIMVYINNVSTKHGATFPMLRVMGCSSCCLYYRRFGFPGVIRAVPLKIATWTCQGFTLQPVSYRTWVW